MGSHDFDRRWTEVNFEKFIVDIGIIGWGVVGSACGNGFKILNHTVRHCDPKYGTTINNVLDTDIVFVCVPTPSLPSGACDTTLIKDTVLQLKNFNYSGVIAIKSTTNPGTTQSLIDQYQDYNICYVPEFLREVSAEEDFISNHNLLVVGCVSDHSYNTVVEACGHFPKNHRKLSPTETEILKYYSNTFNALRVVFANIFFEMCEKLNADYSKVLESFLLRTSDSYLQCSENLRGYGGPCLPKDVKAMKEFCKELEISVELFNAIDHDNNQFKITIPKGMRPNESH